MSTTETTTEDTTAVELESLTVADLAALVPVVEKLVMRSGGYHTDTERLADLQTLDRLLGPLTESHRGPVAAPAIGHTANANAAASDARIDALSAQIDKLTALLMAQATKPVAVPAGSGEGVVTTHVATTPAAPVAVPSGTGNVIPPIPPASATPVAPVAVPSGTGDVLPGVKPLSLP